MNIKEQLQYAINYCNAKLSVKGVAEQATSVVDIGNKIESIQSEDTGLGSRQWWLDICKEKTNFSSLFANTSIETIPQLDTSKGKTFNSMFYYCRNLTTIPQLDVSNGTDFNYMFQNCSNLITIPQLDTSNGRTFNDMFKYCYALENTFFVAGCIKKSISFVHSPLLNDESRQSIFDGLADLTGQTSQTITFHSNVKNKLTEEQIASATSKNWNIA